MGVKYLSGEQDTGIHPSCSSYDTYIMVVTIILKFALSLATSARIASTTGWAHT